MASVNITQFRGQSKDHNGYNASAADLTTLLVVTNLTYSTATQSAKLNAQTSIVRLLSDTDCCFLFGSNPTVTTTTGIILKAGVAEYFSVSAVDGELFSFITKS